MTAPRLCQSALTSFILVATLVSRACGASTEAAPPPTPESGIQWRTYKSLPGRFLISLPDDPKKLVIRDQKDKGSSHVTHFMLLKTYPNGKAMAFLITYENVDSLANLKPNSVYLIMAESLKSELIPSDHLLFNRRIQVGDNPGVEYRYWSQKNNVKAVYTGRFILVNKRRWFHLSAIMAEPQVRSGYGERFLNSFKLLR